MSSSTLSIAFPQTKWSSNFYYTIGLVGFTLGLAQNLYLFKHLRELGSLFWIPFIILSLTLGIPLAILELSLSQYSQKGLIRIWAVCPIMRGVGYLCLMYLFSRLAENMSMLAYLSRYIINTFSSKTGWDSCDNKWNTKYCFTVETNVSRRLDCYDVHGKKACDLALWQSSEEQYWLLVVQSVEMGFQWKNLGYLVGITVIAYSLTFKGLVVIEKISYWSLVVAIIGFLVLYYTASITQGARFGLGKLFRWNSKVFKGTKAWTLCCRYVLNSNNLGSGGLRTLGAQSDFRAHSYMNGMLVVLVDITATVLYTMAYFTLSGVLTYHTNGDFDQILGDDEAEFWSKLLRMLQRLKGPSRVWIWLFFSTTFLIVFVKSLMLTFVIVRTIFNRFPGVENYFTVVSLAVYTVSFFFAIWFFTSFGGFIQKKLLWIVIRGSLIFLMNFLQNFAILYIYGLGNVVDDLHFMLGFRLPIYWQILLFLSPIELFVFWTMSMYDFYIELEDEHYSYTQRVIMNLVLYLPFIFVCIFTIYQMRGMIRNCKWENLCRPTESWYLSDPILRKSRQMFSAMSMTKEYLYRQKKKQEKAAYNLGILD